MTPACSHPPRRAIAEITASAPKIAANSTSGVAASARPRSSCRARPTGRAAPLAGRTGTPSRMTDATAPTMPTTTEIGAERVPRAARALVDTHAAVHSMPRHSRAIQTPTDLVGQPGNLEPRAAPHEVVRDPRPRPGRPGIALARWCPRCRTGTRANPASGTRPCRTARPPTRPRPNRRDSTRNRPWNAMSSCGVELDVPALDLVQVALVGRRRLGPDEVAHVDDHERPLHAGRAPDDAERIGERRRAGRRASPSRCRTSRGGAARSRRRDRGSAGGVGERWVTPGGRAGAIGDDVEAASSRRLASVARREQQHGEHARRTPREEPAQRSTPAGRERPEDTVAPILGRTGCACPTESTPPTRSVATRPPASRQPPPVPPALRHGRRRRRAVLVHRRARDPLGRTEPHDVDRHAVADQARHLRDAGEPELRQPVRPVPRRERHDRRRESGRGDAADPVPRLAARAISRTTGPRRSTA